MVKETKDSSGRPPKRWLDYLSEEDLSFIKRFVLAFGSQKDLAQAYGVSYPTVRLRLGRVIEKIKVLDSQEELSAFERVIRASYAEGKLDAQTFHDLLGAYQEERESGDENSRPT